MHKLLIDDVMKMLLEGEQDVLLTLRKQFSTSKMFVENSNVGFFVQFCVCEEGIDINKYKQCFQIGDVDGKVGEIECAVGFILYIKDGIIKMLEAYTNIIEEWPIDDSDIMLSYESGKNRKYNWLTEVER